MGNKALMLGVFLAYTSTTELQVSIISLEMLVTRKVCYFVLIFLQFVKKLLTGAVSMKLPSYVMCLRAKNLNYLLVKIPLLWIDHLQKNAL